jgi:hypothetical protein
MRPKSHTQRASSMTPGCVIFLLDHSFSMTRGLAGTPRAKRDTLAKVVNNLITELLLLCQRDVVYPWFDVAAIGYTSDPNGKPVIGSVLKGELSGRELVSVVELEEHPFRLEERMKRIDDGAGGTIEVPVRNAVWYEAPAASEMAGSPMCAALTHVGKIAAAWCAAHPTSSPPIVIHMTDGDALDGDPEPVARGLRSVRTDDGELLLYHGYFSSQPGAGVVFPASEDELPPDPLARRLFRMSSPLPEVARLSANARHCPCPPDARGMVFNADWTVFIGQACSWMVNSALELLFGEWW